MLESEHMAGPSWPVPGEVVLDAEVRHMPLQIVSDGHSSFFIGCACGTILHMHDSNVVRTWDQHREGAGGAG